MSASKKTKSKTAKSPAPATKPIAPKPIAPKPAAKTNAAPPARPPAAKKPAAAPKPQPVAPRPVLTTIGARVDVGFGNALFIRGEGAGLSWEIGVPMECVGADLWRVALPESSHGHTFKFLVNDLTWSAGPDFTAGSGAEVTLTPEFEA